MRAVLPLLLLLGVSAPACGRAPGTPGAPATAESEAPTVPPRAPVPGPAAEPVPAPASGPAPTAVPGPSSGPAPAPDPAQTVRPSPIAGAWYPGEPDALAREVDALLEAASNPPPGHPLALVAPHAGLRYSGAVAAEAYAALRGRTFARVFVLGPAHRVGFRGLALPEHTHHETPLGKVPVDLDAVAALARHPLFGRTPGADAQEHSIEIQLPFLQRALGTGAWTLVPVLAGRLTPGEAEEAGRHLATVLAPGDLLVASSDFTHWGQGYGYQGPPGREFGPEEAPERLPALLEEAWAALSSRDPARLWAHQRDTGDTVCGFLPLVILLHALPADAGTHLRRMDSSGALTGDWSRSVSYLAAEFTGLWPYAGVGVSPGLTPAEGEALLKLARGTVEAWVRDRRRPTPEDLGVTLTDRLRADSGVFVTLKKGEALRGCIGTIPPAAPLAEGVLEHAVNASTRDHRFPPVQPGELPELTVEVSVLTPPRVVAGPGDIVLGKHGIWITKQGRSAVFLPQVAPEQGWTLEETLEHLCRKAGLAPDDWKAGMTFEVMEAIVVSEPHP